MIFDRNKHFLTSDFWNWPISIHDSDDVTEEVGNSRHPPPRFEGVFAEIALSISTTWSVQLIFTWILLKASCDKYKTPLKNTFGDSLDGTSRRARGISLHRRTCAVQTVPEGILEWCLVYIFCFGMSGEAGRLSSNGVVITEQRAAIFGVGLPLWSPGPTLLTCCGIWG